MAGRLALVAIVLALAAAPALARFPFPHVEDVLGDVDLGGALASRTGDSSLRRALDVKSAHFQADTPDLIAVHLVLDRVDQADEESCDGCAWAVAWSWNGSLYGVVYHRLTVSAGLRVGVVPGLVAQDDFFYGSRDNSSDGGGIGAFYSIRPIEGSFGYGDSGVVTFKLVPTDVDLPPGAVLAAPFAETWLETESGWYRTDRGPDCGMPSEKNGLEGTCMNYGRDFVTPGDGPPDDLALDETGEPADAGAATSGTPGPAGATPEAVSSIADIVLFGIVFAGGGAVVAYRTRAGRRLRRRINDASRLFPVRPDQGRTDLARVEREIRGAFDGGKIGRRTYLRLHARVQDAMAAAPGAEAPPPAAGRAPAEAAARYRHVRDLPRGTFGRAWLAEDAALGRPVVVKELLPEWLADDSVVRAFLREARLAGRLNHPNIVTVHDIDTTGPRPRIIMEYVDGGTLRDRLQRGRLPADEAMRIADDVLAALDPVHESGVCHRDVKPANVLLTREGRAKLADFGIAHVAADATSRLSLVAQPGTPLYMAPEQARGEAPDARTDLYAVAAVLHEMLSGRHYLGIAAPTPTAVLRAILDDEPRLDPSIPPRVRAVLRKGLAKKREDRFPDATAMRKALLAARQERRAWWPIRRRA